MPVLKFISQAFNPEHSTLWNWAYLWTFNLLLICLYYVETQAGENCSNEQYGVTLIGHSDPVLQEGSQALRHSRLCWEPCKSLVCAAPCSLSQLTAAACCTSAPSPSAGHCCLPASSDTEGTRKLGHESCSAPAVLWNKPGGTLERRQSCAKIRASVPVCLWSFFNGWCKFIWRTLCKSAVFPLSGWILIN